MNTQPRQSNFELLRLLAMLAIVAGHMFTEGHLISHAAPGTLFACLFFGSGARIATNAFILLGCHFLVRQTLPGAPEYPLRRRFMRIYSTTFVWCAPLTLVGLAMGAHPPSSVVARSFFPFFGRPLWFASAWMSLLLFVPFLKHALTLPRRVFDLTALSCAAVFIVNSTLADFREGYLSDTLYFPCAYILMGWLELRGRRLIEKTPRFAAAAVALGIYSALVGAEWWARSHWGSAAAAATVHGVATRFLADIKSAPNFAAALAAFVFFAKTPLPFLPRVNALSRHAFAVYVVHQTPAFWPVLWTMIIPCKAWRGMTWAPAAALAATAALYCAVAAAEEVRRRLFARLGGGFSSRRPS